MTDINARLEAHYNKAVEHFGEENVMGVFLYGSWNYNTSLPDSDVDTKCILVPNLYRLAVQPFKITHLDVDGEVCECMPIMHMVANWKKQNINFVEVLFTGFFKLNPAYADFWLPNEEGHYASYALDERKSDMVARYDLNAAVMSMAHQALSTLYKNPSDLKTIMNATRIYQTMSLLTETNCSYMDAIAMPSWINEIRTGEFEVDTAFVTCLEQFLKEFITNAEAGQYKPDAATKRQTDEMLNQFILNLINRRITLD